MSLVAVAVAFVVLAGPLSGEAQPGRMARVGLLSDETSERGTMATMAAQGPESHSTRSAR
jgi:hypothetical protein